MLSRFVPAGFRGRLFVTFLAIAILPLIATGFAFFRVLEADLERETLGKLSFATHAKQSEITQYPDLRGTPGGKPQPFQHRALQHRRFLRLQLCVPADRSVPDAGERSPAQRLRRRRRTRSGRRHRTAMPSSARRSNIPMPTAVSTRTTRLSSERRSSTTSISSTWTAMSSIRSRRTAISAPTSRAMMRATPLSDIALEALSSTADSPIVFLDFQRDPVTHHFASYLAVRVVFHQRVRGVIVFRLPTAGIDRLVQSDREAAEKLYLLSSTYRVLTAPQESGQTPGGPDAPGWIPATTLGHGAARGRAFRRQGAGRLGEHRRLRQTLDADRGDTDLDRFRERCHAEADRAAARRRVAHHHRRRRALSFALDDGAARGADERRRSHRRGRPRPRHAGDRAAERVRQAHGELPAHARCRARAVGAHQSEEHPARAAIAGDRRKERRARGSRPAERCLPRQHLARAAHAAERHHRHIRDDVGRRGRRNGAGTAQPAPAHHVQRAAALATGRRSARPLPHPSGPYAPRPPAGACRLERPQCPAAFGAAVPGRAGHRSRGHSRSNLRSCSPIRCASSRSSTTCSATPSNIPIEAPSGFLRNPRMGPWPISVEDTGRGIAADDLERIFQPLVQGDGLERNAGIRRSRPRPHHRPAARNHPSRRRSSPRANPAADRSSPSRCRRPRPSTSRRHRTSGTAITRRSALSSQRFPIRPRRAVRR